MASLRYRPEIDGLRALAIVPVMLFHAGVPGFAGGYVGVDVFFVISGYLITSIILSERNAGTFAFSRFFERRARRILPGLFAMALACLPCAYLLLGPSEMDAFCRSLLGMCGLSSNFVLWREAGYFSIASERQPLLHTWSLAVEEQFYLLFPPLLLALGASRRSWAAKACAIALGAASFALAVRLCKSDPAFAFYLLPCRAWELLLGCGIACVPLATEASPSAGARRIASEAIGVAGVAAIALAMASFDGRSAVPGPRALLPALGCGFVILGARTGTAIGRVLGLSPLVWIGLISYGAYLWHQPLLAFGRLLYPGEEHPGVVAITLVLSVIMAAASYWAVERPFRRRLPGRTVAWSLAAGFAALVAFGAIGVLSSGFAFRYPTALLDSLRASARRDECLDREGAHTRSDWHCDVGDESAPVSFILCGDSHAAALLPAFDRAGRSEATRGIFVAASGCPPILGVHALRPDQGRINCHELNERVLELAAALKVRRVFLAARWSYYSDGGYTGLDRTALGLTPSSGFSLSESRQALRHGLGLTVDRYRELGIDVCIVLQVPQQLVEPMDVYRHAAWAGAEGLQARIRACSVSVERHRALQAWNRDLFMAEALPRGASVVDLDDCFVDGDRFVIGEPDRSWYSDDDHLSQVGAERLVERVGELLRASASR